MKIAFIENLDSFSYNIIALIKELGFELDIIENKNIKIHNLQNYSHIIIGPGPGNPANITNPTHLPDMQKLFNLLEDFNGFILGICLGHQIIGVHYKSKILQKDPCHGKVDCIKIIEKSPIFENIPSTFNAVRYHSLQIKNIKSPLKITAIGKNAVMAIEHENQKIFGVQFHLESALSTYGKNIIANFLNLN